MTVSTTTFRADYTGNGSTTVFTVPFYFIDTSHIIVYRTQISTGTVTTLTLTTDYTVSGTGVSSGGSIATVTAPTSDQKISILRNIPLTQTTLYTTNDPFPAKSHETALDKLCMQIQQVNEVTGRSLVLPANVSGVSSTLPAPVADYVVGWNGTGTALVNATTVSAISSAATSATNAAASASSASTSASSASTSASSASTSASSASTSATNAAASASSASTSASSASTSATNAAASAAAAAGSATINNNTVAYNTLGFANKFRNPGMHIHQRGGTVTVTSGTQPYTLDGWIVRTNGGTATVSQDNNYSTIGGTSFLRITGGTGISICHLRQIVDFEIVSPYNTQNFTFQAYVINNTGANLTPTLLVERPGGNFNDYNSVVTILSFVNLQTIANASGGVVSYTFATSSLVYGMRVTLAFPSGSLDSNTKYVQISDCELRVTPGVTTGLNATPPSVERRHPANELYVCQRYLYNVPQQPYVIPVFQYSTTKALAYVNFPTTMRSTPTQTITGTFYYTNLATNTLLTCTAANVGYNSVERSMIDLTVASGATAGACGLLNMLSGPGVLTFSAEVPSFN